MNIKKLSQKILAYLHRNDVHEVEQQDDKSFEREGYAFRPAGYTFQKDGYTFEKADYPLERIGVNILDVFSTFNFLFFDRPKGLYSLMVAEVEKMGIEGCYIRTTKSKGTMDFYQDGELVYSFETYFDSDKIFRTNGTIKPFSKLDKIAIDIGLKDVAKPQGSDSENCKAYMKKHRINPNIKYDYKDKNLEAGTPYLKYSREEQQFKCVVAKEFQRVDFIPLKSFHKYCKPKKAK